MFTGIVETVGTVREVRDGAGGIRLVVAADALGEGLVEGGSVAVNGVCLTAVVVGEGLVAADLVPETLARSNLSLLRPGDRVNLERAVRAADRLEGHLVQGHVDEAASLVAVEDDGGGRRLRIALPERLAHYVVEKGSVAVDGVSLTVTTVGEGWFEVALIPHTLEVTTLGGRQPGDLVNLEVDVLAKYVERLLGRRLGVPPAVATEEGR